MTQVEDKNARPGTPVVSHNTGRWKRGRTTAVYSPVCRKRKRWRHWWRWLKRLWGSLPGVPEWRYTTMRCTQIKIKLHTFPARRGGGRLVGVGCNCRLCYYGNAEFSVFFLASLMSTCEQTHTCGKCSATGADGPAATCRRFPALWADCWQ